MSVWPSGSLREVQEGGISSGGSVRERRGAGSSGIGSDVQVDPPPSQARPPGAVVRRLRLLFGHSCWNKVGEILVFHTMQFIQSDPVLWPKVIIFGALWWPNQWFYQKRVLIWLGVDTLGYNISKDQLSRSKTVASSPKKVHFWICCSPMYLHQVIFIPVVDKIIGLVTARPQRWSLWAKVQGTTVLVAK